MKRQNLKSTHAALTFCILSFFVLLSMTFITPKEVHAAKPIGDIVTGSLITFGAYSFGIPTEDKPIAPQALVAGIISMALGFVGFFFFVFMLYAGYLWITAQGNEDKVEHAINLSRTAFIGLLIVFASYAITMFAFYWLTRSAGGYFYYPPNFGENLEDLPSGYE